jgi:hypothetical protein
MNTQEEILKLAEERLKGINDRFMKNVKYLLESGCIDTEYIDVGLLFGVAMEKIVDGYLINKRRTKDYRNMKKF